jgi:hypothetical protein
MAEGGGEASGVAATNVSGASGRGNPGGTNATHRAPPHPAAGAACYDHKIMIFYRVLEEEINGEARE